MQFICKASHLVKPLLRDNYLKEMKCVKETFRFCYLQCNNSRQIKIVGSLSRGPEEAFLRSENLNI